MSRKAAGNLFTPFASVSMLALLTGCLHDQTTSNVVANAKPNVPTQQTVTDFSDSLRCMDNIMLEYGKRDIRITTGGFPDSTGKVKADTKSMVIRALNLMSLRSKAFTFVDYDTDQQVIFADVQKRLQGRAQSTIPDYYIRGSVSQVDDSVLSTQEGASLALNFADLGITKDKLSSLLTIDINIGDTVTHQILPYAGTSNTVAVTRAGTQAEAGGKIGKAGLSLNISSDVNQSLSAATRALIELGILETMGQFTQTPYWKCLAGVSKTNPLMMQEARDWYSAMPGPEQVQFFQRKLIGLGMYTGAPSGSFDPATKQALAKYQASAGLVANGEPTFETYYSLLDNDTPVGGPPVKVAAIPATPPPVAIPVHVTTDHGDTPVYTGNQVVEATVNVGGAGFLYCFYQDADGTIARIFPNRFSSNPYVNGGTVPLSSARAPVKLRTDKTGHEKIQCLTSKTDVVLPQIWRQVDLKPIDQLDTLDQVVSIFKNADPRVSTDTLELIVR